MGFLVLPSCRSSRAYFRQPALVLLCGYCGLSLGLLAAAAVSLVLGKLIGRFGGRNVLAASSLFFSAGLLGISASHHYAAYLASWVIVGVAMGIGFHEAAFAAVARLRDVDTRSAIAMVALVTGLTGAVCWSLSSVLLEYVGWRGVCLTYALLHLGLGLPLNFFGLSADTIEEPVRSTSSSGSSCSPLSIRLTALLAIGAGLGAGVSAFASVHMLSVLQQQYMLSLPGAVALGVFISPAQVGARVIETLAGRHWHPIWTMLCSTLLYFSSCVLLLVAFPFAVVPLILWRRPRPAVGGTRHARTRHDRGSGIRPASGPCRHSQFVRASCDAMDRCQAH